MPTSSPGRRRLAQVALAWPVAASLALASLVACSTAPAPGEAEPRVGTTRAAVNVPTGPVPLQFRYSAAAVRLADGRVLRTGGFDHVAWQSIATAAIYSPATNTWAATASMHAARAEHTLTVLADGRILAVGGSSQPFVPLTSAEIFDPATQTWTLVGNTTSPHHVHTSVLLPSGKVLVVGRSEYGTTGPHAEVFDPATKAFAPTPPMAATRSYATLTRLPSGAALSVSAGVAEIYDETTNAWRLVAPPPQARTRHAAVLLGDGRVLVTAGRTLDDASTLVTTAELFDPAAETWSVTGSPPHARGNEARLVPTNDGDALLFTKHLGSVARYSTSAGTWTTLAGTQADTATLLVNGSILCTWPESAPWFGGATAYDVAAPACPEITSCADAGKTCGNLWTGCGDWLNCGACAPGQACENNVCTTCTPSCFVQCGVGPDGCGGTRDCGACAEGFTCTTNGTCVPACVPTTCQALGKSCGSVPDGCGGTLDCGACSAGTKCADGACVPDNCVPACEALGVVCGTFSDNCGGVLECGSCPSGKTCVNGACCQPTTCAQLGAACGTVPDTCGGTLSCACDEGFACQDNLCVAVDLGCAHAECDTGEKLTRACSACAGTVCASDPYCCNNAWDSACVTGAQRLCGSTCTCPPTTCAAQGKTCGSIPDGCGGWLACGTCAAGTACDGNVCKPLGAACAHGECAFGVKLARTCSSCASTVCGQDSFCCNTEWDAVCVNEARSLCGLACP